MVARALCTGVVLVFAVGAFCGLGPETGGLLSPMGLLFLGIAALVWRGWDAIVGNFSPALFDGMTRGGPQSPGNDPVVAEIYPDRLGHPDLSR